MVEDEEHCRTVAKGRNQLVAADEEGLASKTASGMVVPRGCSLMIVVAVEGTVAAEVVTGKVVDAAAGFAEELGKEAGLVEVAGYG